MDNETENIPENVSSEAPGNAGEKSISVGTILREARERLGLSVDEVFNRIKFAPRQIAALEADDFAHLPEITFVRGFVRSYARLLQLDPGPLLAALPHASTESAPGAKIALTEVPFPNVYSARRSNIIWLAAALVVAIALVLFTLLHDRGSNTPNPSAESQVKVETLELPSMEVLPDSAVQSTLPSVASAVPAQAPVAPAGLPKVRNPLEGKSSVELSAPSLRVDPSAAKVVQKETVGLSQSAGILRMTFDDDSWVEVADKDGKILLSQINPRGSEQNLEGKPPFTLVIGRSAAVHLYYKGKQIDLAPHTKVSTARLTLD